MQARFLACYYANMKQWISGLSKQERQLRDRAMLDQVQTKSMEQLKIQRAHLEERLRSFRDGEFRITLEQITFGTKYRNELDEINDRLIIVQNSPFDAGN
ncbi:MAG: hypothetical protein KBA40_01715 [Candidatus Peribacteraceae bacterium]|nr:hypothetical protein [Candidatus Peribacteraceae bacterium]